MRASPAASIERAASGSSKGAVADDLLPGLLAATAKRKASAVSSGIAEMLALFELVLLRRLRSVSRDLFSILLTSLSG